MTRARRLAASSILIAVVTLLILSDGVHHLLLSVLRTAQDVAVAYPWAAAGLVVLFAAIGAMVAFVSSWLVLPFAVFTWGPVQALLLLWLGWFLGGITCYALGRFIGRPAVGWLAKPEILAQYEQRVSHRSTFGLILLLQLGLPSEIPGYLLGLVRYPFGWYVVALSLAELVHGVPAVLLGAGLLERRTAFVAVVVAVMVVLTLSAAYGLRRRLLPHTAAFPHEHLTVPS
jgi:uncharacterized membrane protein YdjX (TVP38/TMEM64 family)